MISNNLKFSSNINIGIDPILSELIKSFQMQRPVSRSPTEKIALLFSVFELLSFD